MLSFLETRKTSSTMLASFPLNRDSRGVLSSCVLYNFELVKPEN